MNLHHDALGMEKKFPWKTCVFFSSKRLCCILLALSITVLHDPKSIEERMQFTNPLQNTR